MPKIFVYRPTEAFRDCAGVAFAEDGEKLAAHISSGLSWFRHDMGLTSDWQHERYRAKYPDGYELVECIGREQLQKHIDDGGLRGITFDAA